MNWYLLFLFRHLFGEILKTQSSKALDYALWSNVEKFIYSSMQGGTGISSYSRNSANQGSAFSIILPALRAAIASQDFAADRTFVCADLGCASGSNTISAMSFVIDAVTSRFKSSGSPPPQFQAIFSDLTTNDFNTLFQQLDGAVDFFVSAVPGSFYNRLFPNSSIHFSMCNVALQWLSKVPAAVCDRRSSSWNAGKIGPRGAKPEVARAYASQAHEDLCRYLTCRAQETVPGGLATFFANMRTSSDPAEQTGDDQSCFLSWLTTRLEHAWNDLVLEGLIDEETRDSFNIPCYHRSLEEIANAVDECDGAFTILQLEEIECPMPTYASVKAKAEAAGLKPPTPREYACIEATFIKSTMKRSVDEHLKNPDLVEALFERVETRFVSTEPHVATRHAKMALAILERKL